MKMGSLGTRYLKIKSSVGQIQYRISSGSTDPVHPWTPKGRSELKEGL